MSVRKEKKEETRRLLQEAAVQVFHEKGIHVARVSDIVQRAGVAQGTFYNHFKSKEAVFQCLTEDYLAKYGQMFGDYAVEFLNLSDDEQMVASFRLFLRELFYSCRENIATAQLVFGEGAGSVGPYYEISQRAIEYFISLIKVVAEEAFQKEVISFEDSEMAAAMIFGLFQRCLFYFILSKNIFDIDRLEKNMLNFILNGLGWQGSSIDKE